jgi:hypothetical protein
MHLLEWRYIMTEQSTTPSTSATHFPKGFFIYKVGDASPLVEFDGQGKATATLDGQVIVVATYKVIGDVIEILDVEGPYAYPEGGLGKYKWSLNGKVLSFSLIEDNNTPRKKGFAQPFIMQE